MLFRSPFPLGSGNAYRVPAVNIPLEGSVKNDSGSGGARRGNNGTGVISNIIARFRNTNTGIASKDTSPYASVVSLSAGGVKEGDPNDEYLVLKTNGDVDGRITISDWRIESLVTSTGTSIGGASPLPLSGQINSESPVALGSNATVYLTTGRSPVGTSLRVNACTGYFAQFQDFSPNLRKECPLPENELRNSVSANFTPNTACSDFVDGLSRCTLTTTGIPSEAGSACQNFIQNNLTYNGCVAAHKGGATFYKDEWRIYLDRDQELWRQSGEHIRLLDENGLIIASVSY